MSNIYTTLNNKEKVLAKKLYAYYGRTLNTEMITALGKEANMVLHQVWSLIGKLKKKQLLVDTDSWYFREMQVTPQLVLRVLIEMVADRTYANYAATNNKLFNNGELPHIRFLQGLADFLQTKKPLYFDPDYIDDPLVTQLLDELNLYPEFNGVESTFPFFLINSTFQELVVVTFYKYSPIQKVLEFYERNINHPEMRDENRATWKQLRDFFTIFLTGDFKDFDAEIDCDTIFGIFMHAYHAHLKGDTAQAIRLYEEGLSRLDGKKYFPENPIFSYSYSLALLQDNTDESKKKIEKLLKKKELKSAENIIPHLVFTAVHEINTDRLERVIEANIELVPPLTYLLVTIIANYYGIPVLSVRTEEILSNSEYNLLILEASSVNELTQKSYNALSRKLGYTSLISRAPRYEMWERVLDTVNAAVSKQAILAINNEAKASLERVAYLYSPRFKYLSPVLQKTRNGITWSKGRNISLERFLRGEQSGMTDVDKQVCKHIGSNRQSYYGKDSYSLNSAGALSELIGQPVVFLETSPNVAVEVVEGKPEMVLTRTDTHFALTFNVCPTEGLIQLVNESDVRVKVIKLTTKQMEVVKLLYELDRLPLEAEPKLLDFLKNINGMLTIHSDLINSNTDLVMAEANTLVTVQLIPVGNMLKAELFIKPLGTEPPYCKPAQGAKSIVGVKDGEQVQVVRNFKKEKENYQIASKLLQEISGSEDVEDKFTFGEPYDCLELIDALRALTEVVMVEWPEGAQYRISGQADLSNLSLSLKGKNNWFEIEGELTLSENSIINIRELLNKMRQSKGRFVQLGKNEFVALSENLRKQLGELDAITNEAHGKLKVQQFATLAFDKWTAQGISLKGDKAYREIKERIVQAEDATYNIPKQLNAELRDYQQIGFRWMARLSDWGAGACLADDMGLGKTIQSIAMLLYKAKRGPSLIISPASVLLNWQTEIGKFAPSLNVLIVNMADDRAAMIKRAEAYDVVLCTYGLLVTESVILSEKKWNISVLDEAHTIKNKETKTSKAAMLLNADFRLILTGTPIQNHLGEIWNLFQFINPGLLGSLEQFTAKFITPIVQYENKEVQKRLKKLISPFLLRRTKTEVLDELPEKTEILKEIQLSDAELAFYELHRRETENSLKSGAINPIQALGEITKLRQAACNPRLVDAGAMLKSSKLETFLDIVSDLIINNHRALVFSQFTSHLALVRECLDAEKIDYLYLDGSTNVKERARLVKSFQTGEQPLFLISLKAGGLGLNLTAADYVIHLDPWWNPAIEDQASDRAHRIGQQRPVTVYRLIAKNTIEEKILRLHATKKDLADSLLEGSNMAHKLTREELLELLK